MKWLISFLSLAGWTGVFLADDAKPGGTESPSIVPPNIVLILADDLGWGDVGFNGRSEWGTPHLDRLAAEGMVLKRCYSAGVVCAPSRAALMTGRYTIHCGVSSNSADLPKSERTLAEALKPHGYATAMFGKWHGGKPGPGETESRHPLDLGFDEFIGYREARHAWEHFPKELWFGREKKPFAGFAAARFTDEGIAFIERHRDKRFFLYLPYTQVHLHIEAPEEDLAPFRGKFPEKNAAKPLRATYAAMVSRLDKEVGRVLAALDRLTLAERTLVIFTSDHGATFESGNQGTSAFHDSNQPFRGQKRTLWEGGIRVPTALRWPGRIPAGRISNEVFHLTDVMPSCLAAGGIPADPAWKLDGINMLPAWCEQNRPPSRTLFWEWRAEGNRQLAAMRGDLKLVITGDNRPELFNVQTDPAERRSLTHEFPKLAAEMNRELQSWIETESEESKAGHRP
ncbi:MAG: sulfatase-like hydrolase/transferase [Verrucomicrobiales bacterium]